ncbi:MAG: hypothetical protein JWL84_3634 [Rhodospirillales bacterium]|nr:hypothetical protein [Rhodospirillales bacterium]
MSEGRVDENAQLTPGDAVPPHDFAPTDPIASEPLRAADSTRSKLAPILGAILIVVIALVLAAPYWAPAIVSLLPWGGGPEQRVVAPGQSDESLAALDRRIAALEQRPADVSVTPAPVDLAPLRDQIAQQQQALRALDDRLAGIASSVEQRPAGDPAALQELRTATEKLGAGLVDLDARLGKLAATEAGDSRTDQALLLALGQLRRALLGSAPFAADLAAATALAHERPQVAAALTPLSGDAARGIPSLAVLQQRFAASAGAIANAGSSAQPASDDWGAAALAQLRGLVTVRRVGAAAGVNGGPEAAVATAEGALAAGDLAGAVAALETLDGAAAAAAKSWLADAKRRVAAETALDKASGLVTARLGENPAGAATEGQR